MSSAYPYNGGYAANAPPGDDIDELIRMAEAGIRIPKKTESPATHTPVTHPLPDYTLPPAPAQALTPVPVAPTPAPGPQSTEAPDVPEKKVKKEKDKNAKLIYSDNEVSPEEKMAKMQRYAFVPDTKIDAVPIEASEPAVAAVVDE